MLKLTRSQLQRYSVAVLTVVLALLLTHLLWWLLKPTVYPLFFAAVMVSSWYGGIGPGLLATVLATVVCEYFFVPLLYSLVVSSYKLVGLVEFVLVALLVTSLNAALRSARWQAEMNAQEAQHNYERLRQTQESLSQSEERYRLLVQGVTDYAIFMVNPNSHIVSWNVGAGRILGYQEVEIIDQPFSRIFTPEAIERGLPDQILQTAVAEGFSRENRWHVRKDGTQFWANCVVTPLRDSDGNLRGFSKIMQDMTQRKQTEEERNQLLVREQASRAEAEATNRSKDEFLAILSHELRTPLTAILGWAGMLQAGKLDEARAALALETISRNAGLQMQLIEDLLDVSRIIRGEFSLSLDSVDLVRVITRAIEVVQPAADAKAIQLEFVLDAEVEPILGDLDRLQQVVWNLLSNAIKFTPSQGRVEVRLSVEASGAGGAGGVEEQENSTDHSVLSTQHSVLSTQHSALIQVSDTGKGISADFLPYVFDRFRQADSKNTRSDKGLGLGLAIARHLVELHGGTIQVESPGIGLGATFTLKLPLLEESRGSSRDGVVGVVGVDGGVSSPTPPTSPTLFSSPAPLPLTGLRVLVVDDDADTQEWITIVIQECGAQVTAVGSVEEALAALENLKPDVLLSDIGMPGEDGYALIRKIRELSPEIGGRIPAVALTAYASVEDYREALSAGFQLHVAKPIRAAELVAVVASLAQLSGKL